MNINRETYEEYFLLYADNELSAGARKAVEAFVEANPDLQAEFELFLSLRLEPDLAIRMEDKSELLKRQDEITGMEEQMLLHLDGELSAEKAATLESAIHADETLKEDWIILNRTKLEADLEIRYPGRAGLYRHETGKLRIVRFRWIQYAAAAAVILVSGLLWINKGPEAEQPGGQLAINDHIGNAQTGKRLQPAAEEASAPASTPAEQGTVELADYGEGLVVEKIEKSVPVATKNTERTTPGKVSALEAMGSQPDVNLRQIASVLKQEPIRETQEPNALHINESPHINRANVEIVDQAVGMQDVKSDYATQALMGNVEDANAIDIMDQETDRNRKGFRGLVRKANRFLNKVTNPEMDRPTVKVANIEVSLGR